MDEFYEEYLEEVIEIAEEQYDISKEEIVYNNEHFERCYYEGTTPEKAVFLLSSFCI